MKLPRLLAGAAVLVAMTSGVALADAVNIASDVGIAETTRTFSVNPADFDRDGKEDVFLVRHNPDNLGANIPYSTLYRGTSSNLNNYATSMFGRTDKHGCAWGDANVDGRPDMFCAIGLTQKSKNELWIQNADGSFSENAQAWGLTNNTKGRYRYATFIHANNDLRPDIYVARFTGPCKCEHDYPGDSHPNELWINNGTTYGRDASFGLDQPIGAKKDNASCAQAVDFDKDSDEDLLVCGGKKLYLYRNDNGTGFTDVTAAKGIKGNAPDARLVDLNGDGWRDFVKVKGSVVNVRYGNGSGGFGTVTKIGDTSGGHGLAFGKFDSGTTTDVYVLNNRVKGKGDQPDKIFLNRGDGTFDVITIPKVKGLGDDVAALDWDGNGRDDFIVVNGDKKKAGPVQLWTWR